MSVPGISAAPPPGGYLPPVRTAGVSASGVGAKLAESLNRRKVVEDSAPRVPLPSQSSQSSQSVPDGTYSLGALLGLPVLRSADESVDPLDDDDGSFSPGEFLQSLPESLESPRSGASLAAAALSKMMKPR